MINRFLRTKAARITAVHRVITNQGIKSPGIINKNEKVPSTNDDYVKLVEKLKNIIDKPTNYKSTRLSRVYLEKKVKVNFKDIAKPSEALGDTYSKRKDLRSIKCKQLFFNENICKYDFDFVTLLWIC